jgi:hypothetical protein
MWLPFGAGASEGRGGKVGIVNNSPVQSEFERGSFGVKLL